MVLTPMNIDAIINYFDRAWGDDGIIGMLRDGKFNPETGEEFLADIRNLEICKIYDFPKRFVAMLWFLPNFLEWQTKRVEEVSKNLPTYMRFTNEVMGILMQEIGVP